MGAPPQQDTVEVSEGGADGTISASRRGGPTGAFVADIMLTGMPRVVWGLKSGGLLAAVTTIKIGRFWAKAGYGQREANPIGPAEGRGGRSRP